jgi:two-component system chemotaxis sensor kinase CheA
MEQLFANLNFADMPVPRDLLSEFVDETLARVQHAQDCLLALERSPYNTSAHAALLRALHTIKGNAGYLGAEEFVFLTHAMEELLIQLQTSRRFLDAEKINLLLEGADALQALVRILAVKAGLAADGTPVYALTPLDLERIVDRMHAHHPR